ncbi:MAG TPA: hypothetical protein VHK88_18030 [Aquihabitans sp.]|nr:hypothetical protein [Aquihabitans sp.]
MTQRTWFPSARRMSGRGGRRRPGRLPIDPSVREELAIIAGRRAPNPS